MTWSTFSPTLSAPEFKIDLISILSSYMEKIEDGQVDELTATRSAIAVNHLVNACFEVILVEILSLSFLFRFALVFFFSQLSFL